MKHFLVVFSIAVFTLNIGHSQIQPGTIVIGGNIGFDGYSFDREFSSNTINDSKNSRTSFAIKPRIGKFTSSTTLIGIGLNYDYSKTKSDYFINSTIVVNEINQNSIFINPYLDKYISIGDRFYLSLHTNLMVGFGKRKTKNSEAETNIFEIRLSTGPGLIYFLNNNLALSANAGSIYYAWNRETLKSATNSSEDPKNSGHIYGISFELNTFSIGLQYYLRTKSDKD